MKNTADSRADAARKWWLGPILWALLLFVASSIPGTSYPQISFEYADKVVHTLIYGTLGALLAVAARLNLPWSAARVWWFSIGVATLYGATDEFHQLFVPNRSADLRDLLADALGAGLGAAATLGVLQAFRNTRRV
ncbi:MAG: VanZ family protein [Deltaproteobacteria bacterium]|nr:VanZ family protein [Deltaproteobacteria bacterium]